MRACKVTHLNNKTVLHYMHSIQLVISNNLDMLGGIDSCMYDIKMLGATVEYYDESKIF